MTTHPLTIERASACLRDGSLTSQELVEAALHEADRQDDRLGTFLCRFQDEARASAQRADAELAAGTDRGPLHGIPLGVKDILAAAEGPTTAQSLVLDPAWGAGKDAPAVRRLRAAGAVIVGKTTTLEFAMGFPDETKPFPIPRNPWRADRWAGGSSSGTGNGIAAGMMLGGLGTDTGASIRMPAAFCGVTGHKPTYGLVPKSGCVPLGYSLDVVGPLARSAWDCAALLQVIAGGHPSDLNCSDRPVEEYVSPLSGDVDRLRVGVMRTHTLPPDTAAAVIDAFDRAIQALRDQGVEVVDVEVPLYLEVAAAMMVTVVAEGGAYHRTDMQSRWNEYFHKTRTSLAWGAFISGADYVQAQRVRSAAQRALQQLFAGVDLVVTPTASAIAPLVAELSSIHNDVLAHVHTPYWSAVGAPALAVPIGFHDGMPLSMQIAGPAFADARVLKLGHAYQQVTDWHLRRPAESRPEHAPSQERR